MKLRNLTMSAFIFTCVTLVSSACTPNQPADTTTNRQRSDQSSTMQSAEESRKSAAGQPGVATTSSPSPQQPGVSGMDPTSTPTMNMKSSANQMDTMGT